MKRYWIGVLILMGLGIAIRLAIAPLGAHPGDFSALTQWAIDSEGGGWDDMYRLSEANYPPLSALMLKASRTLYVAFRPEAIDWRGFPNWHILLKFPAIAADGLMMAVVGWLARARRGGIWLVASVALHPALIQMSGWWGQYDSVYAALAFAAIVAALWGRPLPAGVLLGLAAMVKLQALAITPALYAIFLQENRPDGRLASLSGGLAAATLTLMLPFIMTGQTTLVLNRLAAVAAGPGWPTINALNLWYLLTGGAGNWAFNAPLVQSDASLSIAGVPARTLGFALLALWTITVTWLGWRARSKWGWTLAAALLCLGLFLWPTQAHERYALGAIPLLAGAAALRDRQDGWYGIGLYAIISLMHSLNLLWAAPPFDWLTPGFAGQRGPGILISLLFLLAALFACWRLYRPPAQERES